MSDKLAEFHPHGSPEQQKVSRRSILKGLAAALGLTAFGGGTAVAASKGLEILSNQLTPEQSEAMKLLNDPNTVMKSYIVQDKKEIIENNGLNVRVRPLISSDRNEEASIIVKGFKLQPDESIKGIYWPVKQIVEHVREPNSNSWIAFLRDGKPYFANTVNGKYIYEVLSDSNKPVNPSNNTILESK